jgi:hypothetical protein
MIFSSCNNKQLFDDSLQDYKFRLESFKERSKNDTQAPTLKEVKPLISCKKYCGDMNHFSGIVKDDFSYLAFANFGYLGIGRCRGHAILTQKLIMLASFNEYGGCDLSDVSCLDIHKEKIEKLKKFKKVEINGFKNLYDFSSHPRIQPILRGIVAGTSNRYKAPKPFIKLKTFGSKNLTHYYEAKRRVRLGQMPYVGVLGALTGAHGLLAYKESSMGSQTILCAKDPNYATGSSEVCDNYFYEQDGDIFYKQIEKDADKMFKFSLTGDEDQRMNKYSKALENECLSFSKKIKICK